MNDSELTELAELDPHVLRMFSMATDQGVQELASAEERLLAIKRKIPLALNRINLSVDMDFNTNLVQMVSVADKAVYICVGNNNDARDIITVSYGPTADTCTPLKEFTSTDGDDYQAEGMFSSPMFWQHATRQNDFPVFELRGTPTEASVMKVRYRMKTPALAAFPDSLDLLLVWGLLAELAPRAYEVKYADMLSLVSSRHQGAGREYKRVRMDPDIAEKQAYYDSIQGYG